MTAQELIRELERRGETLAVAESLTGGRLAATLVDVPGASAVFRGGLVVYATDLKSTLAGVPADLLEARGPVDPQVAAALASGARRACGADWGLGTTGVAGPDPQDGVAVGTVFIGCAGPPGDGTEGAGAVAERVDIGGAVAREEIQRAAVAAALDLLARALASTPRRTG